MRVILVNYRSMQRLVQNLLSFVFSVIGFWAFWYFNMWLLNLVLSGGLPDGVSYWREMSSGLRQGSTLAAIQIGTLCILAALAAIGQIQIICHFEDSIWRQK
jgi:hypothetical protein